MNTLLPPPNTTAILAQLLERMDRSAAHVDAHQYRSVALRLSQALADPDVNWPLLLDLSPAASALYENLHYAHAGLCREPVEAAARAELMARDLIDRARQRAAQGPAHPA